VLGKLGDEILSHRRSVGRLAFDRKIVRQCANRRRIERAIDRHVGRHAAKPHQLALRRTNKLRRVGLGRGALGGFRVEAVEGRDHDRSEPVAGHGPRKILQIVDTGTVAALGEDGFELALLVLAGGLLGCGGFRLLARGIGFPGLFLGSGSSGRRSGSRFFPLGLLGPLLRLLRLARVLRSFRLALSLGGGGTPLILLTFLLCRSLGGRGPRLLGGLCLLGGSGGSAEVSGSVEQAPSDKPMRSACLMCNISPL